MRTLRCLVPLLFVSLACAFVRAADAPAPLRVMSFNVRLASVDDGADRWANRREMLFDVVARFHPSLVGFQEVVAEQHDELVQRFPGYGWVGVAREDGKRKGEWALIGYEADRFTALDQGNFWLSKTPEVPGSKSWHTAWTRICTWVRLRDRASGRVLLYANTHLDNESALARKEACRLISIRLPKIAAGAPIVLTGDFNMNEDDPSFAPLVHPTAPEAIGLIDSYREVHPNRSPEEASFHAFHGGTHGSRIDFIFHSTAFTATAADIDHTHNASGHYPSDHFPVSAVLTWR